MLSHLYYSFIIVFYLSMLFLTCYSLFLVYVSSGMTCLNIAGYACLARLKKFTSAVELFVG
jgi:hypothetical protein